MGVEYNIWMSMAIRALPENAYSAGIITYDACERRNFSLKFLWTTYIAPFLFCLDTSNFDGAENLNYLSSVRGLQQLASTISGLNNDLCNFDPWLRCENTLVKLRLEVLFSRHEAALMKSQSGLRHPQITLRE